MNASSLTTDEIARRLQDHPDEMVREFVKRFYLVQEETDDLILGAINAGASVGRLAQNGHADL